MSGYEECSGQNFRKELKVIDMSLYFTYNTFQTNIRNEVWIREWRATEMEYHNLDRNKIQRQITFKVWHRDRNE